MEDSRPIAVETTEELAAPAAAFTYAPSPDERREAYRAAFTGQIAAYTLLLIAYAVMITLFVLLQHQVDWIVGILIGMALAFLVLLLQIFVTRHRMLKRDLKKKADAVNRFTVFADHFVVIASEAEHEKARYTIYPADLGRVIRRKTVTVFTYENLLFFVSNALLDDCEPLKGLLESCTSAQKSADAAGKSRFLLLFWLLASLIAMLVSAYTYALWQVSPLLPLLADLVLLAVPLSMAIYALTRKGQAKKLLLYAILGFAIAGWILVFRLVDDVRGVSYDDSYDAFYSQSAANDRSGEDRTAPDSADLYDGDAAGVMDFTVDRPIKDGTKDGGIL